MEGKSKQFRKRNAILSCLQSTDLHPSAEMVHQMLQEEHPDISLATVYRNLSLFKDQGKIQSLGTVKGIERFDANTAPHVHFVCGSCSAVLDLHQMEVPQSLCENAEICSGCKVDACQLMFQGTCRDCLAQSETA
jgi:Fur family peroxide stress response transcriptional regulator